MKRKSIGWICVLSLWAGAAWMGAFCAKEPEVPAAADDPRITLTTRISVTDRYTYCGHEIPEENTEQYVGMDREEFSRRAPGLLVRKFSAEEVVAERRLEQYCPEHQIVQLREGRLWVVSSEPGSAELTARRDLGIGEEKLLLRYREDLRGGMVVTRGRSVEDILGTVCK